MKNFLLLRLLEGCFNFGWLKMFNNFDIFKFNSGLKLNAVQTFSNVDFWVVVIIVLNKKSLSVQILATLAISVL